MKFFILTLSEEDIMRYLAIAVMFVLAATANGDGRIDQMANQLTESTVAECDGDPKCLVEASKEFGALADRAREGARRTEQVLEDARRILEKYKE